ncbi:rRNA maturation RNase YbeY [Omnitrophica bacterium]|nr:rRNA maturation RNase YbeY [Candidatus Omnitrophota bacterium]
MATFEIELRNQTRKYSVAKFRVLGEKILKALGWKRAGITLFFVADRGIRRLNRRYLKHDRPTDVIAFSHLEGAKIACAPAAGRPVPYLGDVVISLQTAARMAKQLGYSFEREVTLYLCHGILHLMGYDDKTRKGSEKMKRKQEQILKTLGF